MKHKLGRRGLVRIVSFTSALVVALTATAVGSFITAHRFRTHIEYSYQRALSELNENVNNIDMTLQKGQYATTANQMQGLSTQLLQSAGYAKGALAQLPVHGEELNSTYKFLSQVGEFCLTLSKRVSEGGKITDDELSKLDQLADYAKTVSAKLQKMVDDVNIGDMKIGEVTDAIADNKNVGSNEVPTVDNGFRDIEEGFTNYPTMIYDGPFSDNIEQQTSKFLSGKPDVTAEQAMQTAVDVSGSSALQYAGDTDGNLPCYNFTADNLSISITKTGGYVNYMLNSRQVGEPTMSNDDAINTALKALENRGMTGFAYRYYSLNNGVLTVNFAATQDGVVLYPDLIKVGIAMDDGSVVSIDTKGYLMNHTQRNLPKITVSEDKARGILSSKLTPVSHAITLIPTDNLNEVLCHEFLCEGQNGESVLVYINVQTGMEEKILIVLQDETGVLAM